MDEDQLYVVLPPQSRPRRVPDTVSGECLAEKVAIQMKTRRYCRRCGEEIGLADDLASPTSIGTGMLFSSPASRAN